MSAKCTNGARVPSDRPARGLIEQYEEVAQASQRMLEAACLGDWKEVESLELHCQALIEALRKAALASSLSDEEQERRFALLRSILKDDARIRACAEPWLRNLDEYLS
jgi:hypothetical protein